jgi:hypothetical protein
MHRAFALLDDPHDCLERRRLADAVASQKRDHFARADVEGDAMQNV